MNRICKVIAACHAVADLMKIDLIDIEAMPVTKDINVRASILAERSTDGHRRAKWYRLFTGDASKMSQLDRELARGWQEGWTRRIFDPNWQDKL